VATRSSSAPSPGATPARSAKPYSAVRNGSVELHCPPAPSAGTTDVVASSAPMVRPRVIKLHTTTPTSSLAGYEAGHPWPDAKYGAPALQAETKAKIAGANVPHGRKKRHNHNINCRGKVTPLDSACELTTPNFGNAVCAGTAEPQADKAVGATCTVTSRKIRD
jgi:hypothetical protein